MPSTPCGWASGALFMYPHKPAIVLTCAHLRGLNELGQEGKGSFLRFLQKNFSAISLYGSVG